MKGALEAVSSMHNTVHNGVSYECSISHGLKSYLASRDNLSMGNFYRNPSNNGNHHHNHHNNNNRHRNNGQVGFPHSMIPHGSSGMNPLETPMTTYGGGGMMPRGGQPLQYASIRPNNSAMGPPEFGAGGMQRFDIPSTGSTYGNLNASPHYSPPTSVTGSVNQSSAISRIGGAPGLAPLGRNTDFDPSPSFFSSAPGLTGQQPGLPQPPKAISESSSSYSILPPDVNEYQNFNNSQIHQENNNFNMTSLSNSSSSSSGTYQDLFTQYQQQQQPSQLIKSTNSSVSSAFSQPGSVSYWK